MSEFDCSDEFLPNPKRHRGDPGLDESPNALGDADTSGSAGIGVVAPSESLCGGRSPPLLVQQPVPVPSSEDREARPSQDPSLDWDARQDQMKKELRTEMEGLLASQFDRFMQSLSQLQTVQQASQAVHHASQPLPTVARRPTSSRRDDLSDDDQFSQAASIYDSESEDESSDPPGTALSDAEEGEVREDPIPCPQPSISGLMDIEKDLEAAQTPEVQGPPVPDRFVSHLTTACSNTLEFKRWMDLKDKLPRPSNVDISVPICPSLNPEG